MVTARNSQLKPPGTPERMDLRVDGSLRLAVIADTHSSPHPRLLSCVSALRPDAVLHAGDVGELRVLDELATVGRLFAVRGNIDARLATLPDALTLEIGAPGQLALRILLLHVGVYGPKLRAEVHRLARGVGASLVVCGHSHVPFIGVDRGVTVFNPGSAGPRRFALPIVFGIIDVTPGGLALRHIDCESGQSWEPPLQH